jgi:small GTP-binding protein
MIQKKICLIGGHAVGKTSLVSRFVKSMFSEKYHTSIGVKIDKKVVAVGTSEVSLMIWDLAGEDEFGPLEISYLRGASGYLLVLDGTRRSTLDRALAVHQRALEQLGIVPIVVLLNKADLAADWELGDEDLQEIGKHSWPMYRTSAKTGDSVDEAFTALATAMLLQQ